MIIQKDSLAFLEEQKDFAFDINYSDPPYALGSEIYIRPDGKFDYKKATDFMNKWEMPTGEYWEKWFEESFRTLKHGGYCVMFGIDRQLAMFQYYAIKAGFQVRQSMYWYSISGFPKATDLSKMIDKKGSMHETNLSEIKDKLKVLYNLSGKTLSQIDKECGFRASGYLRKSVREDDSWGIAIPSVEKWKVISKVISCNDSWIENVIKEAERKIIGIANSGGGGLNMKDSVEVDGSSFKKRITTEINITESETNLAKKYEGYKYSIAPLKQTCETIMIFQKPYKTGSCLHDTLAYENGDETCACFAWNIDGGRVSTYGEKINIGFKGKILDDKNGWNNNSVERTPYDDTKGRYPSQTFCDSEVAERLDEQSGLSKSAGGRIGNKNGAYSKLGESGFTTSFEKGDGGFGDIGGCSKILHKCDYENGEMDLYVYAPKVSKTERNAGCEEFDDKLGGVANDSGRSYKTKCSNCEKEIRKDGRKNACECEEPQEYYPEVSQKNNHPTLKPISLSYRILTLFKTPNPQKIVYPFAGVQSEVIGGYKAGFEDFSGCELNAEYIEIGNVRFEHWKDKPFDEKGKVIEPKKETKAKAKKEEKPKKKPNVQLKLL